MSGVPNQPNQPQNVLSNRFSLVSVISASCAASIPKHKVSEGVEIKC